MRSRGNAKVGRCEHCGGVLRADKVRVYRSRSGRHVLFEGVPALVCTACGFRVFEPDAVEAMEHELKQPRARGRRVALDLVRI